MGKSQRQKIEEEAFALTSKATLEELVRRTEKLRLVAFFGVTKLIDGPDGRSFVEQYVATRTEHLRQRKLLESVLGPDKPLHGPTYEANAGFWRRISEGYTLLIDFAELNTIINECDLGYYFFR